MCLLKEGVEWAVFLPLPQAVKSFCAHSPPTSLLKTFLSVPAMTGGPDFHLENLATLCLQHLPA